jgi:glycosyltransferase involved in cell wall biosynthesis
LSAVAGARLSFVVDSTVFGGAEQYVAHLLNGLPDRFTPTLLTAPGAPAQLLESATASGVPVVEIPSVRAKLDLPRLAAVARTLRRTRPDLVHVNMATAGNNRHVAVLLPLLRLRGVATLHSLAELTSGVQRALLTRAYRRLSAVIAVAEEERRQLCEELGLSPAAVRLIWSGVVSREPVTLRERPERLRVGSVGRLSREKGFDVLLEALARMSADGVAVEVEISGMGPERAALDALAEGLPARLLGFVEDRDAFLAGLDVFCLPSRWEGLPFSLLEAMMAGLPCVASEVGDVAAVLGPAGVVVPREDPVALADALRVLARSPERRLELGRAAHERARERHSVERMVGDTAALYDEVLSP